jgi:hypothetical protein
VCGGKLKIIAVIEELAVIERVLTHLGLSRVATASERSPNSLEYKNEFFCSLNVERNWP